MSKFYKSDRFIPFKKSISIYKSTDAIYLDKIYTKPLTSPVISLRSDTFLNLYDLNSNQSIQLLSSHDTTPHTQLSSALNLTDAKSHKANVLLYANLENIKPDLLSPYVSNLNKSHISKFFANTPIKTSKVAKTKLIVERSCLKAPGLRDDYYSNLITWSGFNLKIFIALGLHAFTWEINLDVKQINDTFYETITCTSYAPKDFLLIGTSLGKLTLMKDDKVIAYMRVLDCAIYCINWFTKGDPMKFILGNEAGDVYIFALINNNLDFLTVNHFKSQKQQVCSIAINNEENEICVGGNDNCCNIWDITDLKIAKFKFKLKHSAAVKGLAYCPWSKSLLASGGGSRDRYIRFWHSKSGTLLKKVFTNSQITSIIWSKYQKELAVTFGFGNSEKVLAVYQYPSMDIRIEVKSVTGLRFLTSVVSPDGNSIAVAGNDSNVRVYRLWERTVSIVSNPEILGRGTHGSDLIEHCEGILSKIEMIR